MYTFTRVERTVRTSDGTIVGYILRVYKYRYQQHGISAMLSARYVGSFFVQAKHNRKKGNCENYGINSRYIRNIP